MSPSPHPVDEPKETAFLLATGVDLHSPPLGTPAPGGPLLATFPASCFQAVLATCGTCWAPLPAHSQDRGLCFVLDRPHLAPRVPKPCMHGLPSSRLATPPSPPPGT